MEIDIRVKIKDEKISGIRFADNEGDNGSVVQLEGNFLYIIDKDGDNCDGVHIDNIDNLILALKKVKELISINK